MISSPALRSMFIAAVAFAVPAAAMAQSSPGYFMPPSQNSTPAAAPSHQAVAPSAPVPDELRQAPSAQDLAPQPQQPAPAPQQPQMPPIPQLPALPKGVAPPIPVVGVLSVPEVMQKSTAAQGVQTVIQQRQQQLGSDAQAARARIQAEQAAILAERSKLTDAQLEAKEQALRNEIAATQTKFQQRNQAIQNSGQAALGQIESELVAIIRQEADARGMNLVLHREQVVLNVAEFDITDDVVAQLNKLLPSVPVPPSVVTPGMVVTPPDQDQGQDQGMGAGQ